MIKSSLFLVFYEVKIEVHLFSYKYPVVPGAIWVKIILFGHESLGHISKALFPDIFHFVPLVQMYVNISVPQCLEFCT